MGARVLVTRLAVREYAPLVAVVLTWLVVAAVAGPADAVRLLAAVTLARAARALTSAAPLSPVRMRLGSRDRHRQATRAALGVEAAALVGALLALAAIAALFWWAEQERMLVLCLLAGLAIPARSLMPLAAGRAFGKIYRLTLSVTGLLLVLAGWAAGADIYVLALLLAARDWLALPIAFALAPVVERAASEIGALEWREIATHSYALGRRRAVYRFSKSFLQAFLGPLGGIAARTGRGMQLDRKLARFVPDHPVTLGALAAAAAAAAVAMVIFVPEPVLLAVAAQLLRSSAAAANVLLWGGFADRDAALGIRLEDDDD